MHNFSNKSYLIQTSDAKVTRLQIGLPNYRRGLENSLGISNCPVDGCEMEH